MLDSPSQPTRPIPDGLRPYVKLVEYIGRVLGPNSEVVLHDTSDLSRSIVAISNNHVSGRKVGGPATDLVFRLMGSERLRDLEYLDNYPTTSRDGRRQRSSTYFIRDEGANVIGLLCVNVDIDVVSRAVQLLGELTQTKPLPDRTMTTERFSVTLDELTLDIISDHVGRWGISPERMTSKEKRAIVEDLYASGVFQLKGAITRTASALNCSDPTIYRYLNEIRSK